MGKTSPWSKGGEPVIDYFWAPYTPKRRLLPSARAIFGVNTDVFIKPERKEELLRVLAKLKKETDLFEPGCLQFVYGESLEEPNKFYLHEEYAGANWGEEAWQENKMRNHFLEWEDFALQEPTPFAKPAVVRYFRAF